MTIRRQCPDCDDAEPVVESMGGFTRNLWRVWARWEDVARGAIVERFPAGLTMVGQHRVGPSIDPRRPETPVAGSGCSGSFQDVANDRSFHISQSAFKAVVVERQTLVVQPEQMQDRGMKIVNVADILNSLVTELIRRPVCERSFHASAGHPAGEAFGIMISPAGALFGMLACDRIRYTKRPACPSKVLVVSNP